MPGWSPAHAQHPALLPVLPLFQELNCRTVSFRQGDLRYVRQVQAQELFPRVSVLRYDEALAEQYHIVALDFPLVHEDAAGVEVFAEKNATVTKKIMLGAVVISPYEMHPLKIANAVATLNEYSNGRGMVVIGGGGEWPGVLQKPYGKRVKGVGEAVAMVKRAVRGEVVADCEL